MGYSVVSSSGLPDVDVVERVHFIEYGLLTWLFYRAWRANGDLSMFILPVLAGVLVGTLDEWLQWFIPVRVGEARNVLLNLVAIACGLLFGAALEPPHAGARHAIVCGAGWKSLATRTANRRRTTCRVGTGRIRQRRRTLSNRDLAESALLDGHPGRDGRNRKRLNLPRADPSELARCRRRRAHLIGRQVVSRHELMPELFPASVDLAARQAGCRSARDPVDLRHIPC